MLFSICICFLCKKIKTVTKSLRLIIETDDKEFSLTNITILIDFFNKSKFILLAVIFLEAKFTINDTTIVIQFTKSFI